MSDNTTPHKAAQYDSDITKVIPFYDTILDETVDLVAAVNPSPDIWLDTGCGTGNATVKAIKRFPETQFMLADPSPEMLKIAQNKFESYPKVSIIGTYATQLLNEHVMNEADVITAVQCHHYLSEPDRKKAVDVCFSLLKENGLFIVTENIRPSDDIGIAAGKARWIEYEILMGKSREDAEKHVDRFDRAYFPITVDAHYRLLKEAGFRSVNMFWYAQMQAGFYAIK